MADKPSLEFTLGSCLLKLMPHSQSATGNAYGHTTFATYFTHKLC